MKPRPGSGITGLFLLGCSLGCVALLLVDRAGFPLEHGITVARSFVLFQLLAGLGIALAVSLVRVEEAAMASCESDDAPRRGRGFDSLVACRHVALQAALVTLPFATLLARVCAVSLASLVAASALVFAWAGLVARVAASRAAARSAGWLALGVVVAVPQTLAWLAGTEGARVPQSVAFLSPVSLLPGLERDATTPVLLAWTGWIVVGSIAWVSLVRPFRRAGSGATSRTPSSTSGISSAGILLAVVVCGASISWSRGVEAAVAAEVPIDIEPVFENLGRAPGWVAFDVAVDGGAAGESRVLEASGAGVQPVRFEASAAPGEVRRSTWLVAIDRVPSRIEWRTVDDEGKDPFSTHDIAAVADDARVIVVVGVTDEWNETVDRLAAALFAETPVRVVAVSRSAPVEAWLSMRFDLVLAGPEARAELTAPLARLGVPILGFGAVAAGDENPDTEWLGRIERPATDVSERVEAWRRAILDPVRRLDALLLDESSGFGLAGSFGWDGPAVDRLLVSSALLAVALGLGLLLASRRSDRARQTILASTAMAASAVAWVAVPVPEPATRLEGTVVRAYVNSEGEVTARVTTRTRINAASGTSFGFETRAPAVRVVDEARVPLARTTNRITFEASIERMDSITFETVRVATSAADVNVGETLTDAVVITREGWKRLGDVAIVALADRMRDGLSIDDPRGGSPALALGDDRDRRGWPASILARLDRFVPLLGDRILVVGLQDAPRAVDSDDSIRRLVRPVVWVVSLAYRDD